MVNRQNYLDVRDFVNFHRNVLQNTEHTAEQKRTRLQNALIWADEIPFSECWKVKQPYPVYLVEMVKNGEISNDFASRLCTDFREFLQWQVSENRDRYAGLKNAFIESIRVKTYQDSAKTADYYTLEDMQKIAEFSPENLAERRIQAGACFLYLSGMRIGAFLSMPIECVNLDRLQVMQFPEMGVYTKFKKRAVTSLYNIPFLLVVVREWDSFVRSKCPLNTTWYERLSVGGWALDPKKPEIEDRDKAYKELANLKRDFYRKLETLCQLVDVDYKHPHAFRHGHIHYGLQNAQTAEQVKAISQNVMHGTTAITDKIYSRMGGNDINNIITNLGTPNEPRNNAVSGNSNGLTAKDLLSAMSADEKKKLLQELLGL